MTTAVDLGSSTLVAGAIGSVLLGGAGTTFTITSAGSALQLGKYNLNVRGGYNLNLSGLNLSNDRNLSL
jgi:hypothetical protein